MKSLVNPGFFRRLSAGMLIGAALLGVSAVIAQPSSRPLLSNPAGAKPNLMVAIDNSGSMAFTYHESYNITDENEYHNKQCPSPYSNVNSTNSTSFNSGVNGQAIYTAGPPETWTCYERYRVSGTTYATRAWTNVAIDYNPVQAAYNWSAQRSSDVNPIYYNPRVRYLPRVNESGVARAVPDNIKFVSNQVSVNFTYDVLQRDSAPYDYRYYHSMYANDGVTKTAQGFVNDPAPAGFSSRYRLPYTLRIPQHITYTNPTGATPAFSYAYCTDVVSNGSGQQTGCKAITKVNVVYGAPTTYTILGTHDRTDCSGNVCTNAQEVTNILNWYLWYSTRIQATGTAIGLALTDVDNKGALNNPSKFDAQLRIGYMPINDTTIPNGALGGNTNLMLRNPPSSGSTSQLIVNKPGQTMFTIPVSRGVRTLSRGSTDNQAMFTWLDNLLARGATPLHNSITQAATYYQLGNGVTENPWRTVPTNASSPEMSCRRSFNLLFSDGGWTSTAGGADVAPHPAGPDYDNIAGTSFSRTLPDGSTDTVQYSPSGILTPTGRLKYVPFPSPDRGGLADLTANYYWNIDMRTGLANGVQTRPGQPTFWQNMATYTVGYLVQPTGAVTGTGLTFSQINTYISNFTTNTPPITQPSWPTGDLLNDTTTTNQMRVDDFIHAGYTGGARSFSARTANDVKSIFNIILAEIANTTGRDAGVSVSSSSDGSSLAGALKYSVSYQTLDNSGAIVARELDANGNETGVVRWSTDQVTPDLIPAPASRQIFTITGTNTPISFSGDFSSLPIDVQNALKQGTDASRIANDASFINYLRGNNAVTDTSNRLFRQRVKEVGAMVNPPAELMNYSRDYHYDEITAGGVDGWDSYKSFAGRKLRYPSSLFVATNAGVVHSFNASTGVEQAGFMPRRSMKRLLNFAAEPYNFEYVLDGPVTQNDIFDRSYSDTLSLSIPDQWKAWRHIAVGSGGRGEQLIYAINSPFHPGAVPDRIPGRTDFLWETGPDLINASDGNDVTLGYITNEAHSGQTEDFTNANDPKRGRWIVAVNNGHYNGEGGLKAGLVVLDALTGAVVRTIPLPPGYSAGRGLSGVTLVRNYGLHNRVVAAYAGDANGQLWKFNLTGAPSNWRVEFGRPLFTVPGNRPIYGAPAWQVHDLKNGFSDGLMVVFATGILLEESDVSDLGPQTIYGIWDRQNFDGSMVNNATFSEVLPSELQLQEVIPGSATTVNGSTFYAITDNPIDWDTQRGWYMQMRNAFEGNGSLVPGERSIADVINVGTSALITTTVIRPPPPNTETCLASDLPPNYVYLLDARTGASTYSKSFDVTGDGRLDEYAVVYRPQGGFTRGNSVTTYRTNLDGTPLTTYTLPPVANTSDPYTDPEVVGRPYGVGNDGEFVVNKDGKAPCQRLGTKIVGTESGAIIGGVSCPTSGWSRTQIQLSSPPTL